MRRLLVALCLLTAALWSAPGFAQARNQLGPLCTTDTTPADQMIDACNKIVALKVFRGSSSQRSTSGAPWAVLDAIKVWTLPPRLDSAGGANTPPCGFNG